ncbi:excisionase [Agromyces badenianii]|nr:excisionase [Agromyces badenianii]
MSVDKLAHWRLEGTGPKATKLGEPLRYSLENVLAWLRARTDRR